MQSNFCTEGNVFKLKIDEEDIDIEMKFDNLDDTTKYLIILVTVIWHKIGKAFCCFFNVISIFSTTSSYCRKYYMSMLFIFLNPVSMVTVIVTVC